MSKKHGHLIKADGSCFLYNDSDCIKTPGYFFKLTWVLMAIVILCVIAMALYGILNMVEKRVRR